MSDRCKVRSLSLSLFQDRALKSLDDGPQTPQKIPGPGLKVHVELKGIGLVVHFSTPDTLHALCYCRISSKTHEIHMANMGNPNFHTLMLTPLAHRPIRMGTSEGNLDPKRYPGSLNEVEEILQGHFGGWCQDWLPPLPPGGATASAT